MKRSFREKSVLRRWGGKRFFHGFCPARGPRLYSVRRLRAGRVQFAGRNPLVWMQCAPSPLWYQASSFRAGAPWGVSLRRTA